MLLSMSASTHAPGCPCGAKLQTHVSCPRIKADAYRVAGAAVSNKSVAGVEHTAAHSGTEELTAAHSGTQRLTMAHRDTQWHTVAHSGTQWLTLKQNCRHTFYAIRIKADAYGAAGIAMSNERRVALVEHSSSHTATQR